MNNSETSSNFELPSVPEQPNASFEHSIENASVAGPEANVAPAHPVASQPVTTPSSPQQVSAAQDPVSYSGSTSASLADDPVIADDNDLIEKEWVTKAKQIVAATKDDPHKQNLELSKFKADYIKKRYGKDIKIGEA